MILPCNTCGKEFELSEMQECISCGNFNCLDCTVEDEVKCSTCLYGITVDERRCKPSLRTERY